MANRCGKCEARTVYEDGTWCDTCTAENPVEGARIRASIEDSLWTYDGHGGSIATPAYKAWLEKTLQEEELYPEYRAALTEKLLSHWPPAPVPDHLPDDWSDTP